jgi:Ca-activated chloride channel homolog
MGAKIVWIRACIVCLILSRYQAIGSDGPFADDQAVMGEQSSIIRVSSNLVTVPVSVTDSEGRAIGNLGIRDFLIEEDNRPETVSRIAEAGQSPLRLALLLDLSGSVNSRFDFEQQAAIRFLKGIWRPGDTVSVVAFTDHPRICLQASGSLSDALQVLSALKPTENPTAFFDAVVLSARALRQSAGPETRQAVIALSDGEDNRSNHVFSEALSEIQRADSIFYSINPGGSSIRLNEISLKAQSDLESLAKETGGDAFVSSNPGDLENIFYRVAADLRAQYLLSYYSANSLIDGKYRRIWVSIPNRADLRFRTRRGYYATPR